MSDSPLPLHVKGFIAELTTPMTEVDCGSELGLSAFSNQMWFAQRGGAEGVLVRGEIGDYQQLSTDESSSLFNACKCVDDQLIIAHVGSTRLDESIRLAKLAKVEGVHALCAVYPSLRLNNYEVANYYRLIGGATPLPMYVYLPPLTGEEFEKPLREILSAAPNVVGVIMPIESEISLRRCLSIGREFRGYGGFEVINRNEGTVKFSLKHDMGLSSVFGCVWPEMIHDLVTAFKNGDGPRADEILLQLNDMRLGGICREVKTITACHHLCGSYVECTLRAPRIAPTADELRGLRELLEKLRLL